MQPTLLSAEFFSSNRENLIKKLDADSLVLVQSAPEAVRNADALHYWRQDSDFYYFTGIDYPDCSLLIVPNPGEKDEVMLFIPPVDPEKEKWTGKMLTKERAKEISGIETVQSTESLAPSLFRAQKWREKLYCDVNEAYPHLSLTPRHLFLSDLRKRLPGLRQKKLGLLTAPLRVVKQQPELDLIETSLSIINSALTSVMKQLKPGLKEYQVEAEITYQYLYNGCKRHGFEPIVASGDNATVLHYVSNEDTLQDGDLLLIDTGGEYRMYSGDITRVFPVNGKFSVRQKACYQAVLEVNKAFIEEVKPGYSWNELHKRASEITGEIYHQYGLIDNPQKHLQVSYHKIGHFLGLDVHDVGRMDEPMEPGTVITVEPGLYLPEEGIGIRIEDDVVLTDSGCRVLSSAIPKEVDEIESLMTGA